MLLGRREFLTFIGATLAVGPAIAAPGEPFRIGARSGGTGISIAGVLAGSDPGRHAAAIRDLRRATGYWRRLRYSSTDPRKAAFAAALAEHFAAEPDLRFAATLAPGPSGAAAAPPGELAELAQFLTGCVYAEAAGATHPLKRDLAAATLSRLRRTGRFTVAGLAVQGK